METDALITNEWARDVKVILRRQGVGDIQDIREASWQREIIAKWMCDPSIYYLEQRDRRERIRKLWSYVVQKRMRTAHARFVSVMLLSVFKEMK